MTDSHAILSSSADRSSELTDASNSRPPSEGTIRADTAGDDVRDDAAHGRIERSAAVASELSGKNGSSFWQSLEEIADTDRFKDFIQREYPSQMSRFLDAPERRTVLKLMGASLALAGFNSCTRQPDEKIVPYAKSPEDLIPGLPLYFATAMPWAAGSIGLLVENHMGRPTKIEGNELHPASLGATDSFAQGTVLGLYDPDRATTITERGRTRTWEEFLDALRPAANVQAQRQGRGLRILSTTVTSPTLAAQVEKLQKLYPQATWTQYEPVNRDNARAGAIAAFGADAHVHAHYDKARTIVALDHDFLGGGPELVRATRDFMHNRKGRKATQEMNRLYVVEVAPTRTGAMADHRIAARPSQIGAIARALAKKLGLSVSAQELSGKAAHFVDALAKELQGANGASIVTCGDAQPAQIHALVHAINAKLGNFGATLHRLPPVDAMPQATGHVEALQKLVTEMNAGQVELLIVLGGNPVFDAPVDLNFAGALSKVHLRVRVGQYTDETSRGCDWLVPEAHFLESWSDTRAADGTVALVQPLIAPLYGGKTAHDIVAALTNDSGMSSYDIVRAHWHGEKPDSFETNWRRWLHDGVIPDTAAADVNGAPKDWSDQPSVAVSGFEIALCPDPTIWDGRFANNGWLQESPKPMTKVVWENTVYLSPTTAEHMSLDVGDIVEVEVGGRKVRGPVWVAPGHADECATIHFGYGSQFSGHVAKEEGFDAYPIRTTSAMWMAGGVTLRKTGDTTKIATTQDHVDYDVVEREVEKRELLRVRPLEEFKRDPHSLPKATRELESEGAPSIYDAQVGAEIDEGRRQVGDYAWGMVIDLSACTACGACVTACVAENNIPVVGKDQVRRGRHMHWIRVDRYFEGPKEDPRMHSQPVPCMQCENAPCELVCPVEATTHSPEGLNEMTYNRCVGTRYCSNNCPYKVRRFNFLLYSDYATETLKMQRNPDVSVRSRGVMEKCTYCVQRINQARIAAKRDERKIKEGEVVTACQQVCPAAAITFGDIRDLNSAVAKLKTEPHNYSLLGELQTRPRTTYLAKIRNPNPDLETA